MTSVFGPFLATENTETLQVKEEVFGVPQPTGEQLEDDRHGV